MEWSEVEVFKLINLFKQFPCLWDFQSSCYKRVDKKKHAWEEISKNMCKNEDIVKKKMKNLRSAYLVEKKKVSYSKKSGSSVEDLYIPHLYYFHEMSFLDRAICLRQTTSSLEDPEIFELSSVIEIPQDSPDLLVHDTYDWQKSFSSETSIKDTSISSEKKSYSTKKRKTDRDEKINIALDAIISQTSDGEKETMFSCFGKSVGLQLEKMAFNTAMDAMAEIQKLLTAAVNKRDILEESMMEANIF